MDQDTEKKKSFFSRIADVIFEEAEPAEAPSAASLPAAATSGQQAAGEGRLSGEDDRLYREIVAAVESRGELLQKFLDLTDSLREIVPQESACFQAALTALGKTSGASKADLLAAADLQLAALEEEKADVAESVQKKLDALQASGKKAETVRARISELQKTIQALEQEEQRLYAEMAVEEKLVRTAQLRFETISRTVERDIRARLEKIRNFLPDGTSKPT